MNTNPIKIVAIGDSITYGYPYDPALSWFDIAAQQLNIEYTNRGMNGDTTGGMLKRFPRDVLRCKPSHVIIMGGTNDAYAGIPGSQVLNNIHAMSELAVKNEMIPVIGLPIPCNDVIVERLLGTYREEMRHFASDNHIEIIDFYLDMVAEKGANIKVGLDCDGVHPSSAGYKVMAGVATKIMAKIVINTRVL